MQGLVMVKIESYEKLIVLIKQAQGDRSLNQFALNCNVNAGHLSRVLNGKFVNPPKPEFLKKIAQHAHNNVSYESLMDAAGYIEADTINCTYVPQEYTQKYEVTARDRKQYLEQMKEASKSFFMNDEYDEEDKRNIWIS